MAKAHSKFAIQNYKLVAVAKFAVIELVLISLVDIDIFIKLVLAIKNLFIANSLTNLAVSFGDIAIDHNLTVELPIFAIVLAIKIAVIAAKVVIIVVAV
jgi:hypothetical protein